MAITVKIPAQLRPATGGEGEIRAAVQSGHILVRGWAWLGIRIGAEHADARPVGCEGGGERVVL